ncbi:MAG: hypothetical protein EP329_05865 [Deltaproteobacteria bacterium]|nr:MAG: hypothetical protein EP329_05865 [Deltaproteobacteria bacterium]
MAESHHHNRRDAACLPGRSTPSCASFDFLFNPRWRPRPSEHAPTREDVPCVSPAPPAPSSSPSSPSAGPPPPPSRRRRPRRSTSARCAGRSPIARSPSTSTPSRATPSPSARRRSPSRTAGSSTTA